MKKEKAWVWFKGGEEGGSWIEGFLASEIEEEEEQEGILIEKSDFVSCRVPEWRISLSEPKDKTSAPEIPEGATWKYK